MRSSYNWKIYYGESLPCVLNRIRDELGPDTVVKIPNVYSIYRSIRLKNCVLINGFFIQKVDVDESDLVSD